MAKRHPMATIPTMTIPSRRDPVIIGDATLYCGDALEQLRRLPSESVQVCVTSPPYFGLRDYGTATWEGGEGGCDHLMPALGGSGKETLKGTTAHQNGTRFQCYKRVCGKCGAQRVDKQIGLEQTPFEYVERLVAVFGEVHRVLRSDGVLFVVMGDSYAGNGTGSWGSSHKSTLTTGSRQGSWAPGKTIGKTPVRRRGDVKPKSLLGIPWRLAFALIDAGWVLRSDIIWVKRAPMPESVKDRCTRSHEHIFMLAKQQRYFYDAMAVAEPAVCAGQISEFGNKDAQARRVSQLTGNMREGVRYQIPGQRNLRDTWILSHENYSDAHFAVFPSAIPTRCILAASRPGDTVLDPFSGAATTGLSALQLGRRYIGIDLNPDYITLSEARLMPAASQQRLAI